MEVQSSAENEARLQDFAMRTGREAARWGKLLDHEEVVARIESMFHS